MEYFAGGVKTLHVFQMNPARCSGSANMIREKPLRIVGGTRTAPGQKGIIRNLIVMDVQAGLVAIVAHCRRAIHGNNRQSTEKI
jgi:hypothetical protein